MKFVVLLFIGLWVGMSVCAQHDSVSIGQLTLLAQKDTSIFSKQYVVKGFFYQDPLPIIVTNQKWAKINRRMPDSVYILLEKTSVDSLFAFTTKNQGQFISVTVKPVFDPSSKKPKYVLLHTPLPFSRPQ